MGATQVIIIGGITLAIIASHNSEQRRDNCEQRRSNNTTLSRKVESGRAQEAEYKNRSIKYFSC